MSDIENTNLINEDEYQRINKKLKLIGKILLIIGAAFFIISLIGFFIARNVYSNQVTEWYNYNVNNPYAMLSTNMPVDHSQIFSVILCISLPIIAVGGIILVVSYRRQIMAYQINTVAPLASEVNKKYTRPFIIRSGTTFGKMYKNFKDEVKDTDDEIFCPKCGTAVKKDAMYCSKCGTKLKETNEESCD